MKQERLKKEKEEAEKKRKAAEKAQAEALAKAKAAPQVNAILLFIVGEISGNSGETWVFRGNLRGNSNFLGEFPGKFELFGVISGEIWGFRGNLNFRGNFQGNLSF